MKPGPFNLLVGNTHPRDYDRGDGYVPSPNRGRERLRTEIDRARRRRITRAGGYATMERLERALEREAAA